MERTMYRSTIIFLASFVCIALCLWFYSISTSAIVEQTATCDSTKDGFCVVTRSKSAIDPLYAATIPKIATPAWIQSEPVSARAVRYTVETRGTITTSLDEFISESNQTLNDSRGWARLGVRFEKVESGGEFILVLSEASQMTTFSATGCDTTYSCVVGNYVIINQDRWLGATPAWNEAGGSLSGYRQMVVNHETGHWLGHGHTFCGAEGQPATVMQQQSMSLQGCTPNSWPLMSEMYSPKLGIRS